MARRDARLAVAVAVTVIYFLAGKGGLHFASLHASATPVWPPAGIALAACLILGLRIWPAIVAGAFLVNVTTAGTVLTSLGIATGNTLEAVLGAFLVLRFANGLAAFERASDLVKFVAAMLASTTVSATMGVTSLSLGGHAPWSEYGAIWLTWWLGDIAGDLLVAPLLVLWSAGGGFTILRRRALEALALLLTATVINVAIFGGIVPPGTRNFPMAFLCIPPLLWGAFRFGPREASTLVVVLATIATAGTLSGFGPFARATPNESLLLLQAFMGTTAAMVLAVAALVWERMRAAEERERLLLAERGARARAEDAEDRLAFLGEIARSITSSLDLDTVLQRIATGATVLCRSDTAAIFLRDGETDAMVARYRVGPWPAAYHRLRISPGEGLGGQVMQTARPLRTANYLAEAPPVFHDVARETETVALMVVPIVIQERAEGLIYISNRTARPFTDEDETVSVRLAEQAAVAIHNARLFAREGAARVTAEAANRAKDEFLAMLGHELRNPLAAITSAVQVLSRAGDDPGQATHALEIIERQVRHLGRLVDDLLDVARVVTGKVVLRPEPLQLSRVVERALAAVRATHRTDERTITVQAEPVVVHADATRLEQVVTNLVVNALKYTPPGGEITIAVQRDGAEAVLTVRDTGMGIAPDLLPRVFDLFVQGDRSLQRTPGGLGVGLTLVRRLVELHGGRVAAASDGDGRGSTFTVRLPAAREAERGDRRPVRAVTPRRVLIVEDNDDAREMLRELLRLLGHEVYETGDGASGVTRALELQPDLTLVDVGLPEIDGYEVARRIRSDPAGARLYLAALTGYGRPEDRERALAAGYDVHLVKPIDQGKLERLLVPLGGG